MGACLHGGCDQLAADETMIERFSGMSTRQFAKLIRQLRAEGAEPPPKGRPWKLRFEDRVLLLVAAYWRTNLAMRQIAALFGTSATPTRPKTLPGFLDRCRTPLKRASGAVCAVQAMVPASVEAGDGPNTWRRFAVVVLYPG
jgi:hypothetical protein